MNLNSYTYCVFFSGNLHGNYNIYPIIFLKQVQMRCSLMSVWVSRSRQATPGSKCLMCPIPHWINTFPSFIEAKNLSNNGCDIFQIAAMSRILVWMDLIQLGLFKKEELGGGNGRRNGRSSDPCHATTTPACCCVCGSIFGLRVQIDRLLSVLAHTFIDFYYENEYIFVNL